MMFPMILRRNGWTPRHALLAILLVGLGLAATFDVWADIVRIAEKDEESSHIFLVPLVAVWLVWVRRWRFRVARPRGALAGPVLVGMGWLLGYLGDAHMIQAFWHAGAILVVVGCLVAAVGTDVLARFMPAFVALAFLIPVPGMIRQQIAIPLQTATASVTQTVLETFGQEVIRNGNRLSVNGVEVAIAEACNGLRMVFALFLVSYAFTFGTPLRNYVRGIILLGSPVSAIICNVIRLVFTVWLYGNASTETAEVFHDISGWIMIPIAFLMLMAIIRILRWALIPVTPYTLAHEA
jgi:exosortase